MPRRNLPAKTRRARKRTAAEKDEGPRASDLAVASPPGWEVRFIQPAKAVKEYRCPGCNHEIRPGFGHIVAWRLGDEGHRRHWHKGCWEQHRRRTRI